MVIKTGSVRVTIYHGQRSGYPLFRVGYYEDGRHRLENFGKLAKAEARAREVADLLARGEVTVASLRHEDVRSLVDAQQILDGSGLTVRDACYQLISARKELDGRPLGEAVRHYVRTHPKDLPARFVSEVADELYESKETLGKSSDYVRQLRHQCGKFARMFVKQIADVTASDMTLFVSAQDELAPRTRNNIIAGVRELFSFAKKRGYVPKDFDQLDAVEFFEDNEGEIHIFTPDEMKGLLSHADQRILPALCISAFAGLRSSEVMKLDWSEVDLKGKFITVTAKKAKTKARRLVPIARNLAAWLAPYGKSAGLVLDMPEKEYLPLRGQAAATAGFEWRRNALRHSFCSYRLALTQDAAKVALEAGNSPQMLFQHYRQLVTPTASKRWFAILPEKAVNVVSMRISAGAL